MHNGIFTDLKTVVEFYNTRDTDPDWWAAFGAQEVPENVNHSARFMRGYPCSHPNTQ